MMLLVSGAVLLIISWVIAWNHNLPFSEHSFPFLWLGYILTANGLSLAILGHSLLTKLRWHFVLLFLFSIPFWWIFEAANQLVNNWHYVLPHPVSQIEYLLRASLSFSTVIPAVLSTAYFINSFLQKTWLNSGKKFAVCNYCALVAFITGVISFFLLYKFPTFSFPLVWLSLVLVAEPLNFSLGIPSWLSQISKGKWAFFVSAALGALICGFFWELWNYYSAPKWVYVLPRLSYFKVFEMPILGYLGYLPFGLEVYSFTMLCLGILKKFLGVV